VALTGKSVANAIADTEGGGRFYELTRDDRISRGYCTVFCGGAVPLLTELKEMRLYKLLLSCVE